MTIQVKICGLTSAEAVDAAVQNGAAMTGFVFFPASPRSLDPPAAAALAARVPDSVLKVGVMVDPDDDLLEQILDVVPLDVLQLHGHEKPARFAEVRARTGRKVMKALRIEGASDLAAVDDFAAAADYLLFDTKPPRDAAVPGGHGRAFDWQLLAGVAVRCPWLLAGGIDVANLEAAVRATGASAVDVSSGVEARPGVKDVSKIEALLNHAATVRPARPVQAIEVPA